MQNSCSEHLATGSTLEIEDAFIDGNPLNIDCSLLGDRTDDLDRTYNFSKPKIYCSFDSLYVECARART